VLPLALSASLSACGGGTGPLHRHNGVVEGIVRGFGGGPLEPTPLPLVPVPSRVEVEAQGRVVAHEPVGPRQLYRISLKAGRYVVVATLEETTSEQRVDSLACAPAAATVRSGSTTRLDMRCFGTAG
jgi:hypothetical protein